MRCIYAAILRRRHARQLVGAVDIHHAIRLRLGGSGRRACPAERMQPAAEALIDDHTG